jgi:putative ABC transport system permease protein
MIVFKLIVTNLLRHRVRTLISIAGIAFTVATMLTVVTILQGAVARGHISCLFTITGIVST